MVRATRFTDPASVDAWDNWFRWREPDCLHDRTIDATWSRVAHAIVPREDPEGQRWAHRYIDAFSRWQLLPDERLLRMAGTGPGLTDLESPCATLNVAAFVIAPHTRQARFDGERFGHIAALAVRMLDDALTAVHGRLPHAAALRIGLIGFADALHLLGIGYDDARAVEHANMIGTTLACGTLHGALELTGERGPLGAPPQHLLSIWRDRRVPDALIDAAAWNGVRHSRLTMIEPQPRLALLANHASDALDPQPDSAPGSVAHVSVEPASACAGNASATARKVIRAAIQPWIDTPIDYPLMACGKRDARALASSVHTDSCQSLRVRSPSQPPTSEPT